jgi:hypothetical protein
VKQVVTKMLLIPFKRNAFSNDTLKAVMINNKTVLQICTLLHMSIITLLNLLVIPNNTIHEIWFIEENMY